MKQRHKHALEWVITLSLIALVWALPEFTKTVWAHGPMDEQEELEKGLHGGPLVQFGKNFVEFVVDHESGYLVIFFFDEDMKAIPVPKYHSASGYLTMTGGSVIWVTFRVADEDTTSHLEAQTGIKDIDSFKAVISIKDGENRENFRFRWVPATASE